jgi:hypothetical protein
MSRSLLKQMVASEYSTAENRSSTARINVTVVTVVGIAPVFAQDTYTTTLDISSGRGTYIVNLTVRFMLLLCQFVGSLPCIESDTVDIGSGPPVQLINSIISGMFRSYQRTFLNFII